MNRLSKPLLIVAGLALGGIGIASAIALAPPANDSDAVMHLFVAEKYAPSGDFKWTENLIGSSGTNSLNSPFSCPADSSGVYTFISKPGKERGGLEVWLASGYTAFVPGTTNILQPNIKPSGLTDGTPGALFVHRQGGTYSLGVACIGVSEVNWVSYRTISFDANAEKFHLFDEPEARK